MDTIKRAVRLIRSHDQRIASEAQEFLATMNMAEFHLFLKALEKETKAHGSVVRLAPFVLGANAFFALIEISLWCWTHQYERLMNSLIFILTGIIYVAGALRPTRTFACALDIAINRMDPNAFGVLITAYSVSALRHRTRIPLIRFLSLCQLECCGNESESYYAMLYKELGGGNHELDRAILNLLERTLDPTALTALERYLAHRSDGVIESEVLARKILLDIRDRSTLLRSYRDNGNVPLDNLLRPSGAVAE